MGKLRVSQGWQRYGELGMGSRVKDGEDMRKQRWGSYGEARGESGIGRGVRAGEVIGRQK